MAITTMSGLVAALTSGQKRGIYKTSQTSEGAATWHSLWKATGQPAAGVNPPAYGTSLYIPTNATAGSIPMVNPGGSNSLYLAQFTGMSTVQNKLIIYDRLWACSGFSTVSVIEQVISNQTAVNRGAANGAGVEAWGEVYGAPGATGATWTIKYTNPADGVSYGAYTHPANAESAGQMFPFLLDAGITGVKQMQSFICSLSSGTAGDIGVTLLRRIAEIPFLRLYWQAALDFASLGLPKIETNACLGMMIACSSVITGIPAGTVILAEG